MPDPGDAGLVDGGSHLRLVFPQLDSGARVDLAVDHDLGMDLLRGVLTGPFELGIRLLDPRLDHLHLVAQILHQLFLLRRQGALPRRVALDGLQDPVADIFQISFAVADLLEPRLEGGIESAHQFGVARAVGARFGDEGFEIVRRRLFEPIEPGAHAWRDAVVNAFVKLYRDNPGDFPSECGEGVYRDDMVSCYPVHPELFRRLYDVSTG